MSANLICVLFCDEGHTHMIVRIKPKRTNTTPGVYFFIDGYNLEPGIKGFHVHERGNISQYCHTLGPHYNPTNNKHGDLNDPKGHHGDLGNLYINNDGSCQTIIESKLLSVNELIGRSLVLHSNRDDLGMEDNKESKITGNSGDRICCGVIGYE